MHIDAMLTTLGYVPNPALREQMMSIESNTKGYEKIQKHIMDLHHALKVDNSFVALSNSQDYLKIKIESPTPELIEEAHAKIKHFSDKYKVKLQKLDNKQTYYVLGFEH